MNDSREARKFRILLAEDDGVNRDILRAFLAGQDHLDLTIAEDGRAALEAALGARFDLMIFDHQMPHITGDRVIRFLRSGQSVNSATPVVRFSAEATVASIRRTGGLVDAVLPKPLRRDQLVATIEAILREDAAP